MKQVLLKSLTLTNFRGEANRTTNFAPLTEIAGRNGSGKTRHFDAFIWLLFGKDSLDRKDYEIKTRTADGQELHKVECSVTGILDVDGEQITIKRSLAEDWVKPRGAKEQILKGNHTECWWNDVPLKVSEFDSRVKGIIDPTLFKMLTNPMYFASMDWKLQREQLFQMAGTMTDEELSADNPEFKALLDKITGKSLADYKIEMAARKRRLKGELDEIQPRIDQTHKMMPETEDWDALTAQIAELDKSIAAIDESLKDVTAAMRQASQDTLDKQREIDDLKVKCQQAQFDARAKARQDAFIANAKRREINQRLRDKENELDNATKELSHLQEYLTRQTSRLQQLEKEQVTLRQQWMEENAKQWQGDTTCPTCGQPLPAEMLEQIRSTFSDKQKELCDNIVERGKAIGTEVAGLKESIAKQEDEIGCLSARNMSLQDEIMQLKTDLATMPEAAEPQEVSVTAIPNYLEWRTQIVQLEREVAEAKPATDTSGLDSQRKALEAQRQELAVRLSRRDNIAKYAQELETLEAHGKELAGQIADIEKDEFTMQQFTQTRIEDCEKRINGMFQSVTFRLFDYTLDGNPVETCVPLVNGVPYGSVNTAGQINAGLDIINTLSRFHGVSAPIFCDHAESVNKFFPTQSQMVLLSVSENDLKVTLLNNN